MKKLALMTFLIACVFVTLIAISGPDGTLAASLADVEPAFACFYGLALVGFMVFAILALTDHGAGK